MKTSFANPWVCWAFACLGLSLVLLPVLHRFPANTPLQTLAGLWLLLVCLGSLLFSLWLATKLVRQTDCRLAALLALSLNVLLLAVVTGYAFTRLFDS